MPATSFGGAAADPCLVLVGLECMVWINNALSWTSLRKPPVQHKLFLLTCCIFTSVSAVLQLSLKPANTYLFFCTFDRKQHSQIYLASAI